MVGDPEHLVQRPQVHHQADRQEGAGLRVLRAARARQQAHPGAVHGQPRALHAPPQARHHRRAADEGAGAGGEAGQAGAEVSFITYYVFKNIFMYVYQLSGYHNHSA